ncbi:MAG: DNA-processing protein DprA [Anaerolineae bacterium]
MDEVAFWVGFNLVPGIGPKRIRLLLDHFGDLARAWEAGAWDLAAAGLDAKSIQALQETRAKVSLEREMARVERAGARVLTWRDADYPRLLRNITASPPVLYVRGQMLPRDELALAVVGTRKASTYGREVAHLLTSEIARCGVTIVSGLARGIDGEAHRAALAVGGRTIAVLGSGVDVIYPAEHRELAERIVKNGALVSEYPIGAKPEAGNFPARNRIISGLALGTLVVEAGRESGALLTARHALEQGRDVFAVPGNILAAGSRGVNELIRDGAKPVVCAEDILQELNLNMVQEFVEARETLPATSGEALLLQHMAAEPIHVDELARATGMSIADVSSTLVLMELKGLVRHVGSMNYVAVREGRQVYRPQSG